MLSLLASVIVYQTLAAYPQCPATSNSRCMIESRINCVNKSASTQSDRWCCPGLQCVPLTIEATATQSEYVTTQCVETETAEINSANTEPRENVNIKYTAPLPPILPTYWSSLNNPYFNMTNNTTYNGPGNNFYFNGNLSAQRTDFYPNCAFKQLWDLGLDSNYVPCSVLFYGDYNYYIYPTHQICCVYHFPGWKSNYPCTSNASYGGYHVDIGDGSDLWEVEWFSNFTGIGPIRNIRNMYVQNDTNTPTRFREDLDTGYVDFNNVLIGEKYVQERIFADIIVENGPCHFGWNPSTNPDDKTCVRYAAQNLARTWPCSTPTCDH